jgi:hypothetical protein
MTLAEQNQNKTTDNSDYTNSTDEQSRFLVIRVIRVIRGL